MVWVLFQLASRAYLVSEIRPDQIVDLEQPQWRIWKMHQKSAIFVAYVTIVERFSGVPAQIPTIRHSNTSYSSVSKREKMFSRWFGYFTNLQAERTW